MRSFVVVIALVLVPLARPQTISGSGSGSGMMSGSGSGMMSGSGSGMMSGSGSGIMSGSGSGKMSGSGSGMMSGSGSGKMSGSGSGKIGPLSTLLHSLHGSGRNKYRQVKHHGVGSRMKAGGGKITISKMDDPTMDKNAIEFEPYEIDEMDSMGNKIGQGQNAGNVKPSTTHSYGMAVMQAKNASLGMPKNATAGVGTGGSPINIQKTSSSMSLGTKAKLDIDMSTYDTDGNVTTGAEKWEVKTGDVELDYTLSNWTFCNRCNNGTQSGDQIEMKFLMKSKQMPSKKSMARRARKLSGGAEEYDLGDNGNMVLSKEMFCDGAWKNMTSGYPMVRSNPQGGSLVVIRLPKFTQSCKWDPTIAASTSSDATMAAVSVLSLFVALFAKVL